MDAPPDRPPPPNLFHGELRPHETTVTLVSTSPSSSASFPGGEAFNFSFSPFGRRILAFTSSRIYVLDATSPKLLVERELKVLRRPALAAILDDGSLLAVLSTDHQVNIYKLLEPKVLHIRSFALDNPPRTIALSPEGSVLAAAYDGGIEIYSVAAPSQSTDRRAMKCNAVDSLSFSSDGTFLLGTTIESAQPYTVLLSAPYLQEGESPISAEGIVSQMWTTSILFPDGTRQYSHAVLLPRRPDDEADWIFAYDVRRSAFRVLPAEDLKNESDTSAGLASSATLGQTVRKSIAAVRRQGDLAAVGVAEDEVWMYGLPAENDFLRAIDAPAAQAGQNGQRHASRNDQESHVDDTSIEESAQSNGSRPSHVDLSNSTNGARSGYLPSRHLATVAGLSAVRWVQPSRPTDLERLIVVAPGGAQDTVQEGPEDMLLVDRGRIVIFDFCHGASDGATDMATIEVGDEDAQLLEEETRDIEAEVAIVRRRTVARRQGSLSNDTDRVATHQDHSPEIVTGGVPLPDRPSPQQRVAITSEAAGRLSAVTMPENGVTPEEAQGSFDEPYSHTQPRSRSTLHRAATAAAASFRLRPSHPVSPGPVLRRPDGRGEVPDESDADNWTPPPPPYKPKADGPLPDHWRRSLMPRRIEPAQHTTDNTPIASRSSTASEATARGAMQKTWSTVERARSTLRFRRQSTADGSSRSVTSRANAVAREQHSTATVAGPVSEDDSLSRPTEPPTEPIPRQDSTVSQSVSELQEPDAEPLQLVSSETRDFAQSPNHGDPLSRTEHADRHSSVTGHDRPREAAASAMEADRVEVAAPDWLPIDANDARQTPRQLPSEVASNDDRNGNHLDHSLSSALPSAEQLANLQRRYSEAPGRSFARPQSVAYGMSGSSGQSSRPRAAQGAHPRSTHSLENLRSSSRGSVAGIPSTLNTLSSPNLLRPEFQRLETIKSVASQGESLQQSRSRSLPNETINPTEGDGGARGLRAPLEAKRRGWGKRLRKDREKPTSNRAPADAAADASGTASRESESAENSAPREKGNSRCTVM
ncbi:MAG: hypothetical protein M1817_002238 [Caeruleum heppii]|nr:MAG: hypothetical protein M1817_002238 [Caeruleum heppii]